MLDLKSLLEKSNVAVGKQKNENDSPFTRIPAELFSYKLFYPVPGTDVSLRMLYDDKSKSLLRNIQRHEYKLDNGFKIKSPCLKSYEVDCPVCNTLDTISKTVGDSVFSNCKTTKRFISFAYINNIRSKPKDLDLKPGEVVLFMYPITVAREVLNILKSCGDNNDSFNKFFHSNNSLSFNVSADSVVSTSMYKFIPDALLGQTKIFETDEEYNKLLESLPNLNDMLVPSEVNEDIVKLSQEVSAELSKYYLSGSVEQATLNNIDGEARAAEAMKTAKQINEVIEQVIPQQSVQQTVNPAQAYAQAQVVQQTVTPIQPQPQVIQGVSIPENPTGTQVVTNSVVAQAQPAQPTQVASTTVNPVTVQPQVSQPGMPPCFGNYNELEAKCLICEHSSECATKSM